MLECVILFGHYRDDAVTRDHLRRLRELNSYPVVAVHMGEAEHVAGALDLGAPDGESAGGRNWFNGDRIFGRFLHRGGLVARRYIYLEWDTLATTPVRDHYANVWDCDAVAASVQRIEVSADREWHWFREQYDLLPDALKPFAGGPVPLNGVMLSHRCLEAVAARPVMAGVFCELRLGTLVRACGYDFTTIDWPGNHFWPVPFDPARPGIYHPVKA